MCGCFCPGKGPSKPSFRKRRTTSRWGRGTSLLTCSDRLRDVDPGSIYLRQAMAHSDSEQDPVLKRFLQNFPALGLGVAGRPDSRTFRDLSEYWLGVIDRLEPSLRHRCLKVMLDHFLIVACLAYPRDPAGAAEL